MCVCALWLWVPVLCVRVESACSNVAQLHPAKRCSVLLPVEPLSSRALRLRWGALTWRCSCS